VTSPWEFPWSLEVPIIGFRFWNLTQKMSTSVDTFSPPACAHGFARSKKNIQSDPFQLPFHHRFIYFSARNRLAVKRNPNFSFNRRASAAGKY